MAITRMSHMKEGKKNPGSHLKNSINYILDVKNGEVKTNNGLLVGGNAGVDAKEIYETMINTKEDWSKIHGRQGYHYVISFSPDENVREEKAYEVVKDFCEDYLGEGYDYVFAIHNDHEHMHGHIVFNSVGRVSGYKYRYTQGDWEKYIQPVTDKICKKHGLKELTYENKRVGKSYAEHAANKQGKSSGKKIIQGDIDFAISKSTSYEGFLEVMESFGYKITSGLRRGTTPYLIFLAPGARKGRRDYNLGNGYSVADIQKRILIKDKNYEYKKAPRIKRKKLNGLIPKNSTLNRFQIRCVRKLHQVNCYRFLNPYKVNQAQVRKNLLHIEKIREDCKYIFNNRLYAADELVQRKAELLNQERLLKGERNTIYANTSGEGEKIAKEYEYLKQKIQRLDADDDSFEFLQDRMDELEEQLPSAMLFAEKKGRGDIRKKIEGVKREMTVINRLLREEKELKMNKLLIVTKRKEKTYDRTK